MNKKGLVNKSLFDYLVAEANSEFEGWDFSYIESTGRMKEFPLSWNYRNEIIMRVKQAKSMLDMGTGGGEFLSTLTSFPKYTCATEGYEPNVEIARQRLEPLGIKVFKVKDDDKLPFEDETFELVINKHESYSENEVNRILKKSGIFITQQVGGLNDKEINELLGASEFEHYNWSLKTANALLLKEGLNIIEQKEDITKTRFYDIGAIVYYLKAVPWQVPDFTVEKYFEKLVNIHNTIEENGYVDFTCHRFLIIAEKK